MKLVKITARVWEAQEDGIEVRFYKFNLKQEWHLLDVLEPFAHPLDMSKSRHVYHYNNEISDEFKRREDIRLRIMEKSDEWLHFNIILTFKDANNNTLIIEAC